MSWYEVMIKWVSAACTQSLRLYCSSWFSCFLYKLLMSLYHHNLILLTLTARLTMDDPPDCAVRFALSFHSGSSSVNWTNCRNIWRLNLNIKQWKKPLPASDTVEELWFIFAFKPVCVSQPDRSASFIKNASMLFLHHHEHTDTVLPRILTTAPNVAIDNVCLQRAAVWGNYLFVRSF